MIDVSPSMTIPAEDGETALSKCLTAANMIVQRKVKLFHSRTAVSAAVAFA